MPASCTDYTDNTYVHVYALHVYVFYEKKRIIKIIRWVNYKINSYYKKLRTV